MPSFMFPDGFGTESFLNITEIELLYESSAVVNMDFANIQFSCHYLTALLKL